MSKEYSERLFTLNDNSISREKGTDLRNELENTAPVVS